MVTHNTIEGKQVFWFRFATAVDLNKCLTQFISSIFLYACVPITELPFNLSTMGDLRGSISLQTMFENTFLVTLPSPQIK